MDAKQLKEAMMPNLTESSKSFAKADFWHYTSVENAKKIAYGEISGFYVSSIETMNDIDEAELHKDDADRVFSLCFCNTKKEKIPMWYMYSGLEGKGVSLGITPKRMQRLISSISTVFPIKNGEILNREKFVNGRDFEVRAGWIAYKNPTEPGHYHFKNVWYDHIEKEFEVDNYFIKLYPWYYEDEFRIVFKFKSPIKYSKVFLPIGDLKFKMIAGPGFYNKAHKIFELPEIEKERFISIKSSGLKINMNLSEKCKKS